MMSRSIRAPPCCAVCRFISRRVRITGEAGFCRRVSVPRSHGPAFCRYRLGKLVDNNDNHCYRNNNDNNAPAS